MQGLAQRSTTTACRCCGIPWCWCCTPQGSRGFHQRSFDLPGGAIREMNQIGSGVKRVADDVANEIGYIPKPGGPRAPPSWAKGPGRLRRPLNNPCNQEKVVGPCKDAIRAYYFDKASRNCRLFHYGGCGGNDNRFDTAGDCMSACVSNPCDQEKNPGPCFANFQKYYFDKSSGNCRMFSYGGCGGNGNRFDTAGECMSTCASEPMEDRGSDDEANEIGYIPKPGGQGGRRTMQGSRGFLLDLPGGAKGAIQEMNQIGSGVKGVADDVANEIGYIPKPGGPRAPPSWAKGPGGLRRHLSNPCDQEKDVGRFDRQCFRKRAYYFDKNSRKCRMFIYGGCGGNGNRFDTVGDCMAACDAEGTCSDVGKSLQICTEDCTNTNIDGKSGTCTMTIDLDACTCKGKKSIVHEMKRYGMENEEEVSSGWEGSETGEHIGMCGTCVEYCRDWPGEVKEHRVQTSQLSCKDDVANEIGYIPKPGGPRAPPSWQRSMRSWPSYETGIASAIQFGDRPSVQEGLEREKEDWQTYINRIKDKTGYAWANPGIPNPGPFQGRRK